MKIFFALLLIVTSIAVLEARPATQSQKATANAVHEEFKKIIDSYYAAWNSGDMNQPAQFYDKNPQNVYYDVAPLEYRGWREYSAGVEKNFINANSSVKLTPHDDLKVSRRGNVTWTTLTFHLSATSKEGQKTELECRHTAIWEKIGGRWLVVHEHVSAPLPENK